MEAVSNRRNSAVGARGAVKKRSNSAGNRETVNNIVYGPMYFRAKCLLILIWNIVEMRNKS